MAINGKDRNEGEQSERVFIYKVKLDGTLSLDLS